MRLTKRVLHYQCNSTEVVGITTERIICEILEIPFCTKREIEEGSYVEFQEDITESMGGILRDMGSWKHIGHLNKECDFQLKNGRTVSVKTNSQGDKVCPQNIGQSSLATFNKYFNLKLQSTDDLKRYFMSNIQSLITQYLLNVFVCDDTFSFMYNEGTVYRITRQQSTVEWNLSDWRLDTTRTREEWNESNTIKVRRGADELSLAEVQVHKNRNCIKFRFHLNAILILIDKQVIQGLSVSTYRMRNSYVFKVVKDSKCQNMDIDGEGESSSALKTEGKKKITLPTSFNYIGSKIKLLDFIGETMRGYIGKELSDIHSFMDCFAGTGVVSYYMMQKGVKRVISNDIQHYSAIVSSVWTTKNINKDKVRDIIERMNSLMDTIKEDGIMPTNADFVYNNYTPEGGRMYFTRLNGYKIDKVRQEIENIKDQLTNEEYKCILKVLLYAVTAVSNIASVYGAYLKKFKQSAIRNMTLDGKVIDWLIEDNTKDHKTYNDDIIKLLTAIDTSSVECGYFDSPYNNRGYSDNYHVLETVSRYDNPILKGITGLRAEEIKGAKAFTSKVTTKDAFQVALGALKSRYVFISYSSESIVGRDKMMSIMQESGWENIQCIEQGYTRFKSNKKKEQARGVIEYIFCGQRK